MITRQASTTARKAPDLAAVLAMPRRRSPPPPMPAAPFAIRVKTSPLVRRMLPTGPVVSRAERKGRLLWEQSASEREGALAAIEAIVAGTPRADELDALARAHLIEREAERAIFWQPWRTPDLDPQSSARLAKALAAGRALVLSCCHQGPYFLSMLPIAKLGHVPFAVSGPWFFEQPSPDYWGRRLARWWRGTLTRKVCSAGSFPILRALLERGDFVLLYFDLPGPHDTHFLGKPAMLADGSSRLAVQADAMIVPLRARREGARVWLDVAESLDPRDFADAEELHDALAAVHGDWILELPATMDAPCEFGWGQAAAPDAWTRPPRA